MGLTNSSKNHRFEKKNVIWLLGRWGGNRKWAGVLAIKNFGPPEKNILKRARGGVSPET